MKGRTQPFLAAENQKPPLRRARTDARRRVLLCGPIEF